MKTINFIILVLVIITQSNSLFFPLASQTRCIVIEEQQQNQVFFFYEAIGNTPQNVRVDFSSNSGKAHPASLHGPSGQTSFIDFSMNICITSTDGGYKSIAIDYYTQDVKHLTQLTKKSELYQLHNKLLGVGTKIKDVNRRQIFEEERQTIHERIIEKQQNQLRILVIVKMIIIILVAAAQIYLLKTMLSKPNNAYQPV